LTLATGFLLITQIQAVEDAPEQIREEISPETETPALAEETTVGSEQQIEKARKDLEAAITAADAATGKEKRTADADVARAEQRLRKVMGRAEAKDSDIERRERRGKKENRKADPAISDVEPEKTEVPLPASEDEAILKGEKGAGVSGKKDELTDNKPPAPELAEPRMKEDTGQNPGPIIEVDPEAQPAPEMDEAVAKEEDLSVDKTTRKIEEQAETKKLDLKDKDEARDLIRKLIGKESEVSRAEANREKRLEPDLRRGAPRTPRDGKRDDIRDASAYLLRQLEGKGMQEQAPTFFRRPAGTVSPRNRDGAGRDEVSVRPAPIQTPRYYHEGRRYVRYESRNAIPAILLASAALERLAIQPASRVERYFVNDGNGAGYANELPPESYRGNDAVVVSYPVSKSSMISSNDIIFAQGSTRFADAHSYDMVMALAGAMANSALKDARFVIEGHASAEGSYDDNMRLSQRRADSIVRDMVREGIDPERLIPVGYGESEARYAAESAESLRSMDRNVMVFRIGAD